MEQGKHKLQTITADKEENKVYNRYLSFNWKPIKEIGVWVLIFTSMWLIYQLFYRIKYGDILESFQFFEVPYSVKCFFKEPGCEKGNITSWEIVNLFACLIIGYFVPNQYLVILALSVLIELVEPLMGFNPKYIIGPTVNLSGYALGSLMSAKNNKNLEYFVKKYGAN